jgi:hypothetical protein
VVVPAPVDALPPEVAILRLQEGRVQILNLAVPHAHKRAAIVEATILVQALNLHMAATPRKPTSSKRGQ